eukprot:GEMP01019091.1.p1 GENE.GEMP01019091.1~~GEMP01019091.1.p1  ORF type:complete len:420 (+),score=88.32 GEMP01019091.1:84-1343(+)
MAKGCFRCKRKQPKRQAADYVVSDGVDRSSIGTCHSIKTILTMPSQIDTVNKPYKSPQTQTQRALHFTVDTGTETPSEDLHTPNEAWHPNKSSRTSLKELTSHTHTFISQKFTDSFLSSVYGGEGAPVIHGLTEENREAYWATLQMLAEVPDWECAYKSANPPAKVQYKMDPGNKSGWLYLAMVLPHPLVATMAPRVEVDTWTKWHPYCTKHEMTGDSSTWHYQSHFEQSMAFGAFKMDQNVRVERWVNESDGFFLQSLTTLKPEDIGYVKPRMNRNQVEGAVLTLSPSPNETLMLQLLRFETPIAIPHFIQKFVFGTVAPKLLTQLITNASHVQDPKYPYQERIEEDKCGIYAYLSKLALSDSPKPLSIIESTHALLGGDVMHGRAIKTIQSETRRANKKKEKKKGKTQKKSARSLDN